MGRWRPRTLLGLPNEVLLLIFYECTSIGDAFALAQTCSHLYAIFSPPNTRINILRSAVKIPKIPKYVLEDGAPELIRVPPSSWAFQSTRNSKHGLLMESDWNNLSDEQLGWSVWDLSDIRSRQADGKSLIDAVLEFLQQFHELARRWIREYEPTTEAIIAGAADLQTEILTFSAPSFVPVDMSSEKMLLALTLHFLVLTRSIFMVEAGIGGRLSEKKLFKRGSPAIVVHAGYEYSSLTPTVRVHKKTMRDWADIRREFDPRLPGYSLDANPGVMLEYIVQQSFRLLDTRDPRHWPTVLFALLILYLAQLNLRPYQPCFQGITAAADVFLPLMTDLARYYYICTKGAPIMSDDWDREEYKELVGEDDRAFHYATELNKLWSFIDIGRWHIAVENSLDEFPDKLDYFAHGCVLSKSPFD
ncbi:hypothetical protein BJY01DRAFT_221316 [Aspergillus pseudoustus]|uniref:F-box domain-containing protein n=1 Tax=Aspergillus pseudoustus TaxID=1810923 RepID=A0ABR4JAN6_9EURO